MAAKQAKTTIPSFDGLVRENTPSGVTHKQLKTRKKQKLFYKLGGIHITKKQKFQRRRKIAAKSWKLSNVSSTHNPVIQQLRLKRWTRADIIPATDDTKSNHKHPPLLQYTDEEYRNLCSSHEWTRYESNILMSLCVEYDLRWPVIYDRYIDIIDEPQRTIVDMKERHYTIQNALIERRQKTHNSGSNPTASQSQMANSLPPSHSSGNGSKSKKSKKSKPDREYSAAAPTSSAAMDIDSSVTTANGDTTMDIDDRDLSQMSLFPFCRRAEEERRQKLEKLQRRTHDEEIQLCQLIEEKQRTEQLLKRKIKEMKSREDNFVKQQKFINRRAAANDKKDCVLTTGGVFGFNCGYGVIIQDNWKQVADPSQGALHSLPRGLANLRPHYRRKYLTATHADIKDTRYYGINLGVSKADEIQVTVKFPYIEPPSPEKDGSGSSNSKKKKKKDKNNDDSANANGVNSDPFAKLTVGDRLAAKTQDYLKQWKIIENDGSLHGPATCTTRAMFHTLREDLLKYYALEEMTARKQREVDKFVAAQKK